MDRRHFLHAVNAFGVGAVMPTLPCSEYRVGIVAVGGAGGNVLNDLAGCLPQNCRTIAINTDASAWPKLIADRKIRIEGIGGQSPLSDQTRRLAVRRHAKFAADEIIDAVTGLDGVLLVAGMGGVAGTEISPVVAQVLQRQRIPTVGVPIIPFAFEGDRRNAIARLGAKELDWHVDSLLPTFNDAFTMANGESATMRELYVRASRAILQLYACVFCSAVSPSSSYASILASSPHGAVTQSGEI